jgi:acyl dehydratase
VLGWESCDHTGPVHEGDNLTSSVEIEGTTQLDGDSGGLVHLRSLVQAHNSGSQSRVLDWRFTVLMA